MASRKKPAPRKGRPEGGKDDTADLRIRVPRALLVRIDAKAAEDDRSRDAWVRRLLDAATRK